MIVSLRISLAVSLRWNSFAPLSFFVLLGQLLCWHRPHVHLRLLQNSAFCLGALAHRLPAVVAPNFNAFLSALAPLLALPAQVPCAMCNADDSQREESRDSAAKVSNKFGRIIRVHNKKQS